MPAAATTVWSRYTKLERQATVPTRVETYWKQLSATERQSVLFLDEADLVKQLYKLNFSLLCVGLVQRRLKKKDKAASDEPTYELLEAMEFMDIGTGIMTVKNELVQDDKVDTLFGLVQENLRGFLVHTYVLNDSDFQQLFFRDSETISTWDEYQHLVAILLEQLILKSFVAFLERESLRQMEALLLEEEMATAAPSAPKAKKKKKRRKTTPIDATAAIPSDIAVLTSESTASTNECTVASSDADHAPATIAPLDQRIPQDTPSPATPPKAPIAISCTTDAQPLAPSSPASTVESALAPPSPVTVSTTPSSTPDAAGPPEPSISPTKARMSRLNPKAVEFQPLRRPVVPLKRKFESFIVTVTPDADDPDFGADDDDMYVRDPELDRHLVAIYNWTSSQFGWDFERQEAFTPEWLQPEFLMTQRVVRYFSEPPCALCMGGYCRVHRYNVAAPPSSYWHHPSPVKEYNPTPRPSVVTQ
ncbi:hypothetical protein ACHHYP_11885 [Achlya hypogyna]|uniref:Uncharacterized protein n=1 Tax=Achlya hypogyna TaxID=1202772 RepID=A0A1V9YI66_ACHHY|nr:hypothetical protein ACHHYP_11885 [Achlya hypogyna]